MFEEAVGSEPSAEAWEGLAIAAAWQQDAVRAIAAREEAHRLYRARNEASGAARTAIWLANDYSDFRGDGAVANGWLARARRLLEGAEPCAELAWLHAFEGHVALMADNDPLTARVKAEAAHFAARAAGDLDSETLALAVGGLARVTEGHVQDGMTQLDEAVVAATGGELRDHNAIASTCCYMIHACERVRDFQRAGQWCKRLSEFSTRWRVDFYLTLCRLQYGTVLIWRGDWAAAEAELNAAIHELADTRPFAVAAACVRLGELRRRQGRLDEAVELFDRNRSHRLSQLGRAALSLDRKDPAGGLEILSPMLQRLPAEGRTERAPVLELMVEACVELEQSSLAEEALTELQATSEFLGIHALRAGAWFAEGLVARMAGEAPLARARFEEAAELFERAGLPFEAGRARIELSRTLLELGNRSGTRDEARVARNSLEAIGADHEAAKASAILERVPETNTALIGGPTDALTKRQREVLQLVAEGLSDREIGRRLFISEYTVHRHISNILSRLSVPSRSAAVAHVLRHGHL